MPGRDDGLFPQAGDGCRQRGANAPTGACAAAIWGECRQGMAETVILPVANMSDFRSLAAVFLIAACGTNVAVGQGQPAVQLPVALPLDFPGSAIFNDEPPFLAGVAVDHASHTYRE